MDQWYGSVVWVRCLVRRLDETLGHGHFFPLLAKVSKKERNKGVQSVNMGLRSTSSFACKNSKVKKLKSSNAISNCIKLRFENCHSKLLRLACYVL